MAKPLIVGRKEFAKIYNVAPTAVSDRWIPDGIVSYEDAVIVSGKPYWPGGLAVDFALPPGSRGRQLDESLLAQLEEEQQATVRPMKKGELPPLVGLQEYATLFGISQHQAANARNRGNGMLPAEDYLLGGSPVWLLSTVLEGAEHTMAQSRGGVWQLQEDVAAALREGRYDGPGSAIAARGKAAAGS
ncbi:hypothetical protein [Streptomyces sp. S.PB5]|uniref:hypothetical protein n=1 Tax=Streptomyces sp. S.PB5 TaxID=3020844 RepID=UPI0025B020B2|nr:hypothetical protein [Streptomyces sp. S.PB5]MDN3025696.1 hypothetical protein [Streptomyces sp. S.PB5]